MFALRIQVQVEENKGKTRKSSGKAGSKPSKRKKGAASKTAANQNQTNKENQAEQAQGFISAAKFLGEERRPSPPRKLQAYFARK